MRYVQKIRSNVKGGQEVELGPRTLIVGPNRAGKSAIVNAVELALTGKASDVVGRAVVADVNTLLTLADGQSLFAEATLSDGTTASWRTKGKRAEAPAPYPQALPLREVREALAGNAETVRKFFLRMAQGGITLADVQERVPAPLRELFDTAVAGTPIGAAGDTLLLVLERAKSRARDLNAQAATLKEQVAATTQGAPPVTPEKLEHARVNLTLTRVAAADLRGAVRRVSEAAEAANAADAAGEEVARLRERLATLAPPADVDRVREHLLEVLAFAKNGALPACPCCAQALAAFVPDVVPADLWTDRFTKVKAKAVERANVLREYTEVQVKLRRAEQVQAQAEAQLLSFVSEEGAEEVALPEDVAAKLGEADAAVEVAEAEVIALERADAAWAQVKKLRDDAADKEAQATRWEQLAAELKSLVGTLLDGATAGFVARVQAFLPPEFKFALQLQDGEREVCRYGFMADGVLRIALSGAEWATLSVALAAVMLPEGPGPAILIPEDRAWDPVTLAAVMRALDAAPCQVLLATTVAPPTLPAGWTLVTVGVVAEQLQAAPAAPQLEAQLLAAEQAEALGAPDAPAVRAAADAAVAAADAAGFCKHKKLAAKCAWCKAKANVEKARAKGAGKAAKPAPAAAPSAPAAQPGALPDGSWLLE